MPLSAAGFGRHLRLHKRSEFVTVYQNRKVSHGRFFSIHACPNSLSYPRLGLSVSKHVSKKAVERNRLKRRIKEEFRLHQQTLSRLDFVVVAKRGSTEQAHQTLCADLNKLWSRVIEKCENC